MSWTRQPPPRKWNGRYFVTWCPRLHGVARAANFKRQFTRQWFADEFGHKHGSDIFLRWHKPIPKYKTKATRKQIRNDY